MSVPVGERRESRLEVFVQALDLVTYTLRITKNEKIFLPEYQRQVTDDIIETATDTGKVIMIIDPKNVKERRRILRRLVRKAKRGELTKAKVDECYYAWRNHASKGNSFKLLQRMDKYYKSLWR